MKIEIIPAQDVAYIRRVGPYGPENYAVMDALKSWAWSRGLLNGGVIYGIAYDSPDADPQNCRFDACIVLHDKDQELTDGIILGSLPGGCYAVFMVEHTASAVEAFWKFY